MFLSASTAAPPRGGVLLKRVRRLAAVSRGSARAARSASGAGTSADVLLARRCHASSVSAAATSAVFSTSLSPTPRAAARGARLHVGEEREAARRGRAAGPPRSRRIAIEKSYTARRCAPSAHWLSPRATYSRSSAGSAGIAAPNFDHRPSRRAMRATRRCAAGRRRRGATRRRRSRASEIFPRFCVVAPLRPRRRERGAARGSCATVRGSGRSAPPSTLSRCLDAARLARATPRSTGGSARRETTAARAASRAPPARERREVGSPASNLRNENLVTRSTSWYTRPITCVPAQRVANRSLTERRRACIAE